MLALKCTGEKNAMFAAHGGDGGGHGILQTRRVIAGPGHFLKKKITHHENNNRATNRPHAARLTQISSKHGLAPHHQAAAE